MYKLVKVANIWDEIEIGKFDTQEKAFKKMMSLIKKETKTTDYVRAIIVDNKETHYDYGMYNRFYSIKEI